MPLIRCSDQKDKKTLEEFYKEFIPDKVKTFADAGTPMLKVLKLINDLFHETTIYGLTSMSTLVLLAEDKWRTPWFVSLRGLEAEYYIEYLMTTDQAPWHNAKITGITNSLDDLKKYIIIAMYESRGWRGNPELDRLYNEIKGLK